MNRKHIGWKKRPHLRGLGDRDQLTHTERVEVEMNVAAIWNEMIFCWSTYITN